MPTFRSLNRRRHILIRIWQKRSRLQPRRHTACDCLCVLCTWLLFWSFRVLGERCEKSGSLFWLSSDNTSIVSWFLQMDFSCWSMFNFPLPLCRTHLLIRLAHPAKMPFDTPLPPGFRIPLVVNSTGFLDFLCPKTVSLSLAHLRWMKPGRGCRNDLVCSDSAILFHCRSLCLISLMDYEQANKNRGRQSENDLTPCKGPAGNGLPADK